MRKAHMRGFLCIFLIVMIVLVSSPACLAEGASLVLKTKSTTVEQGKDFRVVMAVSGMPELACFGPVSMTFNPDVFTFLKTNQLTGTGTFESVIDDDAITVQSYNGEISFETTTYLVEVWFRAKKTGSGSFSLTEADGFAGPDLDPIAVTTGSSLSITVTAPVVKSGNNNLKSLEIEPGTLDPDFSPGQASYTVQVAADVGKLTVSAAAEESTAQVSVSDTGLQDGENQITVVVTAENGSIKTYTITAIRAGPSPTPEPSPSPSPSPTPAVTVELPDGTYTIAETPPNVPVPAGFYRTMVIMSDKMVSVFKALKGDLTLYYLAGQTGASGFYYYDSQAAAYKPFAILTLPAQSYSVLSPESGAAVPDGFTETTISLDDLNLVAWKKSAGQQTDQFLLYLMNSQGDKDFYIYDKSLQLLALYSAASPIETSVPPTSETTADEPASQQAPASSWQLIALLLGLLCLILTGLVIWLAVRGRSGGGPDDDATGPGHPRGRKKKNSDWADPDSGPQLPLPKPPPIRRVE